MAGREPSHKGTLARYGRSDATWQATPASTTTRTPPERGVGDDDPDPAEVGHDGERVLVRYVVADVHGEDRAVRFLRDLSEIRYSLDSDDCSDSQLGPESHLLEQPLDRLALVPVSRRPELVDHLTVGPAEHRHLGDELRPTQHIVMGASHEGFYSDPLTSKASTRASIQTPNF